MIGISISVRWILIPAAKSLGTAAKTLVIGNENEAVSLHWDRFRRKVSAQKF